MSNVIGVISAKSKKGTGILVAEQWYNSAFDGQFAEVNKGDSVSFTLVPQGNKMVVGQIEVTAKAPPQAAGGWKGGGGGFKKKPYVDNSIGMAIGMGMNNAVQLCIAEKKKFDAAYIEEKAMEIYHIAEKLKKQAQAAADGSGGGAPAAPVPVAPAPQPQAVPNAANNPFA